LLFSLGVKLKATRSFFVGQEEIEVVEDCVYLSVQFMYIGGFRRAIDKQLNQARKAMFLVLEKARMLKLPVDIIFGLYGKCVIFILLYGSEV